jgi:hypothetical protein
MAWLAELLEDAIKIGGYSEGAKSWKPVEGYRLSQNLSGRVVVWISEFPVEILKRR